MWSRISREFCQFETLRTKCKISSVVRLGELFPSWVVLNLIVCVKIEFGELQKIGQF